MSSINISSPSLFIPQSTPSFPNPASGLSSTFNTLHFNCLTTTNLINKFLLDTSFPLFFHPKFKACVQRQPDNTPTISNSVVELLHPVPEQSYILVVLSLMDGLAFHLMMLIVTHMFVLPIQLKFYDCTACLV